MKKLYRSGTDKKIFGVCGGIARYFGVDSTIIRLALVIITFIFAGFPLLFYMAAWIVLPIEPQYRTIEVDK
ncbi:MAG: hypothetical protein JL50_01440 [Peptococcaceae bacterium BICA1-7]|nr:MAG: hypothetical protein JL50_01440 [Peptococcaceae bacterium BICA1-7]HBV97949.1 PspC domain-containing protein [Desulfotomaculum sp.]